MAEVFNSGMGGYTCDGCSTLLWTGHNGLTNPDGRNYDYTGMPDCIYSTPSYAYCEHCWLRINDRIRKANGDSGDAAG